MEAKTSNRPAFLSFIGDFIQKLNELKQRSGTWLATEPDNETKKKFISGMHESLRLADIVKSKYGSFELGEIQSLNDAIRDMHLLDEQLDLAEISARGLIDYYYKSKTNLSGNDVAIVSEYLNAIQTCLNDARKVRDEMEVSQQNQNNASQASGVPNSMHQSNTAHATETKPGVNNNVSAAPLTDKERLDAVQVLAETFCRDINSIINKNQDWFTVTLDEEDAKLGQAVSAAMDRATQIAEMDHTALSVISPDGLQVAVTELTKLKENIQTMASVSRHLITYYHTKLTAEQYQVDVVPLREFLETSSKYESILVEMEADVDGLPASLIELIDTAKTAIAGTATEETITAIKSDVPDEKTEDSLDIMPDVNALASIITYSKVIPPLAIGLFGNWGSGKSFFMKKLRQQIDVFASDEGNEYVNRVVHIEFNSWHYSDTNLWASFVTKIFEDLDDYGKKHPEQVTDLVKKLNETSEFLTEANTKLAGIKATIVKLETELATKKTEISAKAEQLSGITLTDIAREVVTRPEVESNLRVLRKQLPQKELGNLDDIYRSIKELDGFGNKFIETLKLLLTFKSWKSWVALALFAVICSAPAWFYPLFHVHITDLFNWFGKYSEPAAVILVNAAGVAGYATTRLTRVQEKLKSVAATCKELEKTSALKQHAEIDKIRAELDIQQQAHIQKEAEINKLRKEQAELEASIDDIKSGKKLSNFIASRVNEQRYLNSLGLISWIRRDFKRLDDLMKEQEKLIKPGMTKEEREKIFQVQRIVLYIDDLDRCNEDVVVKVLEAIHLLLAFELFVVVVGVDPRWMHNALENKYSRLLRKHHDKRAGSPEPRAAADGEIDSATSYDYLEKIFQIPVSLNEINRTGKAHLIDDTLKGSVQLKGNGIDATGQTNNANGQINNESADNKETVPGQQAGQANASIEQKSKEEEKKKNEKEIKRAKQKLVLSTDEVNFMKKISDLIGNTPRAVNRYINIYRLLRSHSSLKVTTTPLQDYCTVMVLLGIITGTPDESEEFFRLLAKETAGNFQGFVDKRDDKFKALKEACKVTFKAPGMPEKTVGRLNIEFIKQKFELVQRFSFRSYGENEIVVPAGQQINIVPSDKLHALV